MTTQSPQIQGFDVEIATVLLLLAMVMMTFSPNAEIMIVAQLIAGLAAAAIVPSLVVLIAHNYVCWG